MHGVILAAGEGSRMGEYTADRPKTFLEVGDRTLYERQRAALSPYVDGITVVLGYEATAVRDRLAPRDRALVFEEWREYENGESLRRALADLLDERDGADRFGDSGDPPGVVVLNGDVVVPEAVIGYVVASHRQAGASVVGCLPGRQEGHTAVQCDAAGRVTDYGMIPGHRHAGLGVVAGDDVARAERVLRDHGTDWYPVVYPELDAQRVVVPPEHHVEINRPAHLRAANERLPFDEAAVTSQRAVD